MRTRWRDFNPNGGGWEHRGMRYVSPGEGLIGGIPREKQANEEMTKAFVEWKVKARNNVVFCQSRETIEDAISRTGATGLVLIERNNADGGSVVIEVSKDGIKTIA